MRVLLRCDGGPGIGVGHMVRSLAVAEEARARGHEVVLAGWAGGDFLGELVERARQVGLVHHPLPAGGSTSDLVGAVQHFAPDVVHLDSYVLDDVAGAVRQAAPGALVSNVQDSAFGRREADLVLDPTLGAEDGAHVPAATRWRLLGAACAPLRGSVQALRARAPRIAPEIPHVLVVMGGTDATGAAPAVVEALGRAAEPARVTVVASAGTAAAATAAAARHPLLDVTVTGPVPDLPALMAAQDLVVSASGTSTWELCAMAVPMALLCVVDNQRVGYDRLVGAGAAAGLGGPDLDDAALDAAARVLARLLRSPDERRDLAQAASQVVDGLGAWRLVRTWEVAAGAGARRPAPALRSRRATLEDARTLWLWRNDPETRRRSRSHDAVPWEDHLAWLEGSLRRPDRVLLVVEDAEGPVGTVRWDLDAPGEWEVSITVAPEHRGRSLATPMLEEAQRALVKGRPVDRCLAVVHEDNVASRRLFVAAGYVAHRPPDAAGFETYALVV